MTESLLGLGGAGLSWLVQSIVFGTILAGLTFIACVSVFHRARPTLRALLWTIVLLRFLLPPVLPSLPYLSVAVNWISVEAGALLTTVQTAVLAEGARVSPAVPASHGMDRTGGSNVVWSVLILTAYFPGVILLTTRSIRLNLASRRWIRRLPEADWALQHRVRTLCRQIGLRRIPCVRVTEQVTSPLVLGALRPQLVLSLPLCGSLSSPTVEALIVHELAHLRRGDPYIRFLQTLARLIFYFWPPVYWVCRRIDRAAELACDQWALGTTGVAPREYARSLLAVIRSLNRERTCISHLAFAGKQTSIEERFEMILNSKPLFSPRVSWKTLPVPALWCTIAFAALSPVSSQDRSVESPTKLIVHVKGDVSHLDLPAEALPEADIDQDGHLTLGELQDFQDRNPDRLEFTVEPADAGRQQVEVHVARRAHEGGPAWTPAEDEEHRLSPPHEGLTEADRAEILAENPGADIDGDGKLNDEELKAFITAGPRHVEIHAETVGPDEHVTRKVVVSGPRVRIEQTVTHAEREQELDSAARRAEFLKDHPEADLDGDGVISKAEAEALAAKSQSGKVEKKPKQ